jgi:hypothetical protein
MAAAAKLAGAKLVAGAAKPPSGTAQSAGFGGVPTVGALFATAGASENFCTASVVDSSQHDLLVTAAHCVDFGGHGNYAQGLVYVPGWYRGHRPYGVWPVRSITVASGWNSSGDVNDDFAFLTVGLARGQHKPIQLVTGGLKLGISTGYKHRDVVPIGYDMTSNGVPVKCRTSSFYARPSQQELLCNGYTDGASGGPWITGFNARKGTGTVIGDIGGYQQGGYLAWTVYSPYFGATVEQLYRQAASR